MINDIYRLVVIFSDSNAKTDTIEKVKAMKVNAWHEGHWYQGTFEQDKFYPTFGQTAWFCIRSSIPEDLFVEALRRAFKESKMKLSGELSKIIHPSRISTRPSGPQLQQQEQQQENQ